MKPTTNNWVASQKTWRVLALVLVFSFLAWVGLGPSSAQTTKGRSVVSMKVSDSREGSRVTVVADLTLNDYEAFRRGDRFYVRLPASTYASALPNFRGNGFDEVQVQRNGDGVLISFKLQPGATARVDQRLNRLDVVFVAVPRTNPTVSAPTSSYAQSRDRRTNDAGPLPPYSPANATRVDNVSSDRSNPSARVASPRISSNERVQGARETDPRKKVENSGSGSSSSSVPATTGSNTGSSASSTPSPVASPTATVGNTPESILQTPTSVPSATRSQAAQPVATQSPVAPTSSQRWRTLEQWWRLNKTLAIILGVGLLLALLALVFWLVRRRRARVVTKTTKTRSRWKAEKVGPRTVAELSQELEANEPPIFEEIKRVDHAAEPRIAVVEPVVRSESSAASTQFDEDDVLELPSNTVSVTELPEVKESAVESQFSNPSEFERAEFEVKKLLSGKDFDVNLIDAADAPTRQVIAASLVAALASRNYDQHDHARKAFVDYGYFDETTRDLRTADSPAERAAAARKLGAVGDSRGTAHLIAALFDTAPEVRRSAVESLGQLGDPSAVTPLNDLLQRENSRQLPEAVIRHAINSITVTEAKRSAVAEKPALRVVERQPEVEPRRESSEEFKAFVDDLHREDLRPQSFASLTEPVVPAVAPPAAPVPPAAQNFLSEEEVRLQLEEEALRKAAADLERRRLESEVARQRVEEETRLKLEREAQARAEIEARIRAEEEARRLAEQEALRRKIEEEARLRAEQESRLKAETEARHRAEEEAQFRLEAETLRRAAEELARKRADADAARRAVEEETRKRLEIEARQRAEEEARRILEQETKRKAEEELRLQVELELQRRVEEQARLLAEVEAKKRAEEEARKRIEEETRRHAEEEARRRVEEETRKRAEEEARRRVEEETRRLAEEESRKRAEEQARKRAEEEAAQRAATEARRLAEEQAQRLAEQDVLRRSQAQGLLQEAAERRRQEEERFLQEQQALLKAADEVARRRREVEQSRIKAQEEARLLLEAQERIRVEEENRRKAAEERERLESEARKRAEEERQRFEEARQRTIEEQKRREEEARKKAEEESRLLAEAQQRIRAQDEARQQTELQRQKLEQEARLRAESERRRLEEEKQRVIQEQQKLAEAAKLQAAEEARLLEAAQLQIREEEEARKLAEQQRQRLEAEALALVEERKRAEEQLRLAAVEQKRVEDEARRMAEEEERRLAELESVRKRAEEQSRQRAEVEQRIKSEIEALHKAEEEQRLRIEAETKRRSEAEAKLREEKARRQAEEDARIHAEREAYLAEEARLKEVEESRKRASEDARHQAELEARQRAEDEARRREEDEARERAERQARLAAEEEAQRRAEEEYRVRAEEEARQRAEEEQRRKEQEEAQRQAEEDYRRQFEQQLLADEKAFGLEAQVEETAPEMVWGEVALPESELVAAEVVEAVVSVEPEVSVAQDMDDKGIEVVRAEKGIVAIGDESDIPSELLHRLNSESSVERSGALTDLSRLGGEDAFRFISKAFDDDAADVRNAAAHALYDFHPDRAASFTRALREGTPERRRNIGASLASSGLATDAIANLTGESREKTYDAFSLLFLMAKAGEVQPLMKAIEDYPNIEVRLAVVKLLALSGQPEIVPAFRRLAVRGSLPSEVRSAVMEAIYQISSQNRETAPSAA